MIAISTNYKDVPSLFILHSSEQSFLRNIKCECVIPQDSR